MKYNIYIRIYNEDIYICESDLYKYIYELCHYIIIINSNKIRSLWGSNSTAHEF